MSIKNIDLKEILNVSYGIDNINVSDKERKEFKHIHLEFLEHFSDCYDETINLTSKDKEKIFKKIDFGYFYPKLSSVLFFSNKNDSITFHMDAIRAYCNYTNADMIALLTKLFMINVHYYISSKKGNDRDSIKADHFAQNICNELNNKGLLESNAPIVYFDTEDKNQSVRLALKTNWFQHWVGIGMNTLLTGFMNQIMKEKELTLDEVEQGLGFKEFVDKYGTPKEKMTKQDIRDSAKDFRDKYIEKEEEPDDLEMLSKDVLEDMSTIKDSEESIEKRASLSIEKNKAKHLSLEKEE